MKLMSVLFSPDFLFVQSEFTCGPCHVRAGTFSGGGTGNFWRLVWEVITSLPGLVVYFESDGRRSHVSSTPESFNCFPTTNSITGK